MITLKNINLSSIDLSGIDLRGIKLGLGGRGGGSGDGFPQLPGDVTRWHFGGLTNEMMAAMDDPRIEDADHKGRFLSFKNFAWSGMSGVGGYETNAEIYEFSPTSTNKIVADRVKHISYTFEVKGMVSGNDLSLRDGINTIYYSWKKDGIYTVDVDVLDPAGTLRLYNGYSHQKGTFTVRIFPSYPGAIVFDGVDDWAGCDNLPLLPKEKGYSIIALRNWITRYDATQYKRPLISNLDTNDEGAFLIEYRKDENVNDVTGSYNSFTDVYIDDNNPITWQTSSSYNGQIIKKGTSKSTNKLCICKTYFGQLSNYANAAIWEIVILDHDATEEELTKIKDYFVKTYPWLFPDQAWTVTGKTNEDEDRATIANITGNGNDLVLSNFGFAEGSGYNEEGEYAGYLVTDGVDDMIRSSSFLFGNDFTVVGEWEFLQEDSNVLAGFNKNYTYFVLYNYISGVNVYVKNSKGTSIRNTKTLKAVTSEGLIYTDFNSEQKVEIADKVEADFPLYIAYNGNNYTKMAFKNLAIYPTILSKEDCIKAYNYLQTLKAK